MKNKIKDKKYWKVSKIAQKQIQNKKKEATSDDVKDCNRKEKDKTMLKFKRHQERQQ